MTLGGQVMGLIYTNLNERTILEVGVEKNSQIHHFLLLCLNTITKLAKFSYFLVG